MRALEYVTGHVILNPAYAYKFQLKITKGCHYHCLPNLPSSFQFQASHGMFLECLNTPKSFFNI